MPAGAFAMFLPLEDVLSDRPALAAALLARGISAGQLEASVRAGDLAHSDRMMIERAPPSALDDVLMALSIPRVALLDEMLRAASALQQPLIVGWDGSRGCAKLYVNASDAPGSVRSELGARFGGEPAHIYGVNVFADGRVEHKRYVQRADAEGLGPHARRLWSAAGDLGAGAVTSHTSQASLRAFFVALRPTSPARLDAAFSHLDAFSWNALVASSPFAPASPRSIGISAEDPGRWTAYLKPRDAPEPELFTLEPTARFVTVDAEIALYLAPSNTTARAYARVGETAISYRLLRGDPPSAATTELLEWVVEQLRRRPDAPLADPPPPWTHAR